MKKRMTAMLLAMVLISFAGCTMRNDNDVGSSSEPQNSSGSSGVGTPYDGPLPITDEYVALDAVKDYLGLEDCEQVPDGAEGYRYHKGGFELYQVGTYVIKETRELIFMIPYEVLDEDALAKGSRELKTRGAYAVVKRTGAIFPITQDEIEFPTSEDMGEDRGPFPETKYEGPLPIPDEFVALDAVKEYLGLKDYEQVPNSSGGYTYCKDLFELLGNGSSDVIKETGEPFFLVSFIHWDEKFLARVICKPKIQDDYAVLKETGDIFPITADDYIPELYWGQHTRALYRKPVPEINYEGPLPIIDKYVALDAVKEYLGLEDYEQTYIGSKGDYTYQNGAFELLSQGSYEMKKTGEPIFLIVYICWDEEALSKGRNIPKMYDTFAVLKNTGDILPVTYGDF